MKKALLACVLASVAGMATADVVAPAGADLPAKIRNLTAHTVEVEVVKPAELRTPWDEIAASMAGCRIEGARSPSTDGRMSLKFGTLICPGKPSVAIEAFGVSSVHRRVDLDRTATVGTPLAVLVLANISLPGSKPWTNAVR